MNVQILEAEYKDKKLRYFVFDENKILFNTENLYRILNIKEPIDQKETDLAGAVLLASSSDTEFAMWLNEKFIRYDNEASIRPSNINWQ